MQKMINACFLCGFIKGIWPSKTSYFCTNVFNSNNYVQIGLGGIKINEGNTLK